VLKLASKGLEAFCIGSLINLPNIENITLINLLNIGNIGLSNLPNVENITLINLPNIGNVTLINLPYSCYSAIKRILFLYN
jgi:hypothetical protein